MLGVTTIKEVERLLAEGQLSQRKIAKTMGVSRATVGAIAAGKRPDYEALRLERDDEYKPLGPVARCPGCGGLVHTPCQLCRLRRLKLQEQDAAGQLRRRARREALRRLLVAVRNAYQARDGILPVAPLAAKTPSAQQGSPAMSGRAHFNR